MKGESDYGRASVDNGDELPDEPTAEDWKAHYPAAWWKRTEKPMRAHWKSYEDLLRSSFPTNEVAMHEGSGSMRQVWDNRVEVQWETMH